MNILKSIALALCILAVTDVSAKKKSTDSSYDNSVVETIMSRRSVRKYKDTPVSRDLLRKVVECGVNCPNGMNQQPWQVRIVDSKDYIDGLTAIFREANPRMASDPSFKNMFRNAPAVIFIASPSDGSGQIDCGLMGENIILAAKSYGLGTCCLGGPIAFMKSNADAKPYLDRLNISEGYTLLYAIGIGYPDEMPDAKPRDLSKIEFVK